MISRIPRVLILAVAFITLAAGCATTGGRSQVEDTVYATYRVVKNLDQNLGPSVTKLNETAADLSARTDETDRQMAKLQATMEENQVRLNRLQAKLDRLTDVVYKQFNVSTGGTPAPSTPPASIVPSEVELEQPVVAPAPRPAPSPSEPVAATPAETAPTTPPVPTGSNPVADYQRATDSMKAGRYEEAIEQYKEFLQRYPGSEVAHTAQFRIADCLSRQSNFEQTVAEYQKFRTNYPNSTNIPIALHNEAAAYLKLNQKAKAEALLRELVENYPTSAAAERARAKLKEFQSSS